MSQEAAERNAVYMGRLIPSIPDALLPNAGGIEQLALFFAS